MERLLKMNHQQMCLILQRLETTLNLVQVGTHTVLEQLPADLM